MPIEPLPDDVSFITGGAELLPRVEPLWHALRHHHADLRPQWKEALLKATFAQRNADLLAKSPGGILVEIVAYDGQDVAYCVSTIAADGAGEVDSLFVQEAHRGCGLGDALISRALAWFETLGVRSVTVGVMAGNEAAQKFYERFGFVERHIKLIRTS